MNINDAKKYWAYATPEQQEMVVQAHNWCFHVDYAPQPNGDLTAMRLDKDCKPLIYYIHPNGTMATVPHDYPDDPPSLEANLQNQDHQQIQTLKHTIQQLEGRINATCDLLALVVFLAKHYAQLEALRYSLYAMTPEECKDAVMEWPVIQGLKNQINLKRIAEMEYDSKAVGRAVAAILATVSKS